MSYDQCTGLLKMMDSFTGTNCSANIQYKMDPAFNELKAKYELTKTSGDGSFLSQALNVLSWLTKNVIHDGSKPVQVEDNALAFLDYSFQKGRDFGINCRNLSITLTECLLSLGFKARTVFIMPYSPYDIDNHVICEVWIPEYEKWILLDPTYNCYIMNEHDTILSAYEVRVVLSNQMKIHFSGGFNYNGDQKYNQNETVDYFAKNLFYFICHEFQTFNSLKLGYDKNKELFFVPDGFELRKWMLTKIDFQIKKLGDDRSWLKENRLYSETRDFNICPIGNLLKSPYQD